MTHFETEFLRDYTGQTRITEEGSLSGSRVVCPVTLLLVLCPSGLLSESGSACQLATDDHVMTPKTSNQIMYGCICPRTTVSWASSSSIYESP